VATYSTGITATWGGVAFQEITDLQWTFGGAPAKDRLAESAARWTDEVGTVFIACLGTANVSTAEYGKRKQLVLGGGGQSLTINAIYESVSVAPELNGVTRFTVTFRLLDN
jgi:hypothetical protein